MKHAIRKSNKAIRKAQSVFCSMAYQTIEEVKQAFAQVERVPYMPEIPEADSVSWGIDEAYASVWEGR